jgi:hypothetical protein
VCEGVRRATTHHRRLKASGYPNEALAIGWATHGALQRGVQAAYGLCFYLWKTVWPSGASAGCRVAGDLPGALADYAQAVRFAPPGARYRATFEANLAAARKQLAACGGNR